MYCGQLIATNLAGTTIEKCTKKREHTLEIEPQGYRYRYIIHVIKSGLQVSCPSRETTRHLSNCLVSFAWPLSALQTPRGPSQLFAGSAQSKRGYCIDYTRLPSMVPLFTLSHVGATQATVAGKIYLLHTPGRNKNATP